MPKYVRLPIGPKRVAVLAGLATTDMSCYRPSSRPDVGSVDAAIVDVWEKAKEEGGGQVPDLFLPMTHQLIEEDRGTCKHIGAHPELSTRTPIILGGHEHDIFIDSASASLIGAPVEAATSGAPPILSSHAPCACRCSQGWPGCGAARGDRHLVGRARCLAELGLARAGVRLPSRPSVRRLLPRARRHAEGASSGRSSEWAPTALLDEAGRALYPARSGALWHVERGAPRATTCTLANAHRG